MNKVKELLEAAMGNEGVMVNCLEVNMYSSEIPQGNETKRNLLINLALTALDECQTCGGNGIVPRKYQSCGCIICTCENEEQCQGCGAKTCGYHSRNAQFPLEKDPCPDCGYKRVNLSGTGKYALVDEEDFERVNQYKWRIDEKGRACRNAWVDGKQQNIKMHRFIMNTPKNMLTDHIDYNLLNNRKSNLRICTAAQSSAHRRAIPNTSSKYKGVSWCAEREKWEAHIKQSYKGKWLGRYDTEIEAAKAYDHTAKKLFGEYAELNFPNDCQPKPERGEFVVKLRKMRLCFTNNVGEKPYYRCEDEKMNIYVADDQLFCTIHSADFQGDYDEEIAIAFCEIGEVLQKAADRIEQLTKQVEELPKPEQPAEGEWDEDEEFVKGE